ncbi:hypothetical protein [Tuberibacillus calidus]|uniref:hypothetical protein n=1 Tax=Tuberibacillus calidus TaxID=340097 RepID=UPI00040BEC4A|nr:hypothetical protein [Tuberibacillus calidus]
MQAKFDQTFHINTITIHTVEGASCVNIGNNFPVGFESYKKHLQGFGSISGNDNTIDGLKSLLNDRSLIDAFSGSDLSDSPWIKALMESKIQEFFETEDMMNNEDYEEEAPEEGEVADEASES